jgi:ABC-type glycerol-3-phosphate transport system substrate-binding protein
MEKQKSKSLLRVLLMVALALSLLALAACQTTSPAQTTTQEEQSAQTTVEEEQPAAPAAAEEEVVEAVDEPRDTITIFRGGVTVDWDNDPVIVAIEDRMNVDIQFLTSDWGEINQVRNLAMSTEEDVDIYHHMDTSPQWVEDELIIPVDEYINETDHPYLYTAINSPLFEPMKRNGQTYYIPMISDGSDWVWLVRTDWMEELSLDMPTNEVEFRDMLQAFKDRDPDGRAVGMQMEGSHTIRRSMMPIMAMYGVPGSFFAQHTNYWVDDEGKLAPTVTSENVKEALRYTNGLYQDGLINTDFPTLTSFPQLSEQYIQADKAGVSWFPNGGNFPLSEGAESGFIPPFSATGYEHVRIEGIGTQGWISISSASDNPQKAIDLLEFFNSPEGRKLLVMGVEGLHYQNFDEASGSFERIEENWDYELVYYPLHFYLGDGSVRGYVPIVEYGDVVEGQTNAQIWEPTEGGTGMAATMAASAQWTGAPMMFQFVEFAELGDMLTAIQDAIVTGWTEMITADPAEFEAEWEEYLAELDAAGFEEWNAAYQQYYDENLK